MPPTDIRPLNPAWRCAATLPADFFNLYLDNATPGQFYAEYARDSRRSPRVTVCVETLPREVDPLYWYGAKLEGYAATVRRAAKDGPRQEGSVEWAGEVEGRPCRVHARVVKRGAAAFVAECVTMTDAPAGAALDPKAVLDSFEVTGPLPVGSAEPLMRLATPAFAFIAPSSWRSTSRGDGFRLDNATPDGSAGRIEVRVGRPGAPAAQGVRDYVGELGGRGFRFSGNPVFPRQPDRGFDAVQVAQLPGTFQGRRVELLAHLYAQRGREVAVILVHPARAESPVWWAVNRTAFAMVSMSLTAGA